MTYNIQWGRGGGSRAAPVLGPTVEQGAWVAMAEQGARASMADPETQLSSPPSQHFRIHWGYRSPGGTREVQTLWGALADRAQGCAREERALEGTREE